MTHLTLAFNAVEFIENNLKEPIAVADIAEAVGCSLYHFCRIFNKVIHHPPYDYLMRRRLSESAQALIESDQKIIEIAFDYQFNSPETFSRAFKRMFGIQPYQWRKQGRADSRLLMPRPSFEYIEHINQGNILKPTFVEKEAIQVAGVVSLVREERPVIALLWKILAHELAGLEVAAGQAQNYFGIAWYPPNWANNGFFYMAAIQVESPDIANSALVLKKIPASTYARFIHTASVDTLPLTLAYIYQTWLPKSGRRLRCPLEIEYYGQEVRGGQNQQTGIEIYIPVK